MSGTSSTNIPPTGQGESTRQDILSRLEDVDTRTVDQHAFVTGMKHIVNTTFMSTDATIDALFELFPPEVLCESSCLKLQLLYVLLRDILNMVGINVERRRGLYIPQAIVNTIFSSDNVARNTASSLIAEFKHSNARSGSSTPGDQQDRQNIGQVDNESFWRRVDNANRRFTEKERYSGILAESPNLTEVRKAYTTYCTQKDFPRPDRVKLVSAILKGPALNFWMEHINGRTEYSELGGVFKALEGQFDTPAHQKQIEALACSMTIEDTMKKHNCSRVAALGILYHEVARLNEQFPKVKRGNAFKTQTLMKIVERYEWSRTAEEEVMQDSLTYDNLYTKLSASIVIWENELTRQGRNPEEADDRRVISPSPPALIHFGEQYATNMPRRSRFSRQNFRNPTSPSYGNNRNKGVIAPRGHNPRLQRTRSDSTCFRCGRTGHWRAQCPYDDSKSMISAVRARMREIGGPANQSAAQILFELVSEEDHFFDAEPEQYASSEDNEFEALIAAYENQNEQGALEVQENPQNGENADFQQAGGH